MADSPLTEPRELFAETPTGMLFIPCRDGVSHNPEEYAAPEDIVNAVRLLEKAVRAASRKNVTFA